MIFVQTFLSRFGRERAASVVSHQAGQDPAESPAVDAFVREFPGRLAKLRQTHALVGEAVARDPHDLVGIAIRSVGLVASHAKTARMIWAKSPKIETADPVTGETTRGARAAWFGGVLYVIDGLVEGEWGTGRIIAIPAAAIMGTPTTGVGLATPEAPTLT